MRSPRDFHIVFVFSRDIVYPPNVDNIKVHYVSREFIEKGARVTWLQIKGRVVGSETEGLKFVSLQSHPGLIGQYLQLIRLVKYCRKERANCVYADEWLFLRDNPIQRFIVQIGLKVAGIKYVFDQRDPYIEFQIARKKLRGGSIKHWFLKVAYKLTSLFTDLAILPSNAYAKQSKREYGSAKVTLGVIRGVDGTLFNPNVDGNALRSELGLQGRFVVGWFGMMNTYRQIEEVLIPLIKDSKDFLPDASFIIGGRGPLKPVLEGLIMTDPKPNLMVLGFIDYSDLPSYIAACDVLLCPLNLNYQFTRIASPLKILESLAVARPIIATETIVRREDYAELDGVIWTGSDYEGFKKALVMVHDRYELYRQKAMRQANDFEKYSTKHGISKIADAIREVCN